MNILLINNLGFDKKPTAGGVEYHRTIKPHGVLKRLYPEFDYIMSNDFNQINDYLLNQTDLVLFLRLIPDGAAEKLNNLNIPFGLDLDDYWHLPSEHISWQSYQDNNTSIKTEQSITEAHFVICTTEILADKIKAFNDFVYIIENGIDTEDESWQPNKTKNERIRFGFTQGNTHIEDIKSIADSVRLSLSNNNFKLKGQIVLTGFSKWDYKNITPQMIYEFMLTNKHRLLDNQLGHDLKRNYIPRYEERNVYRRIYARDIFEYATIYNDIDVSLVPLIDNEFNSCKSELKLLEAGFMDCAVMVNHISPYTLIANDSNSFDLNKKPFYDWQKYILANPESIKDKAAQLKEDVKNYDLKLLTPKRRKLYLNYKK